MGKKGPCCHCGIQHTPLWRNGPPGKPVLCNACGSRYRLRGTLENYIPKHANPQMLSIDSKTSSSNGTISKVKEENATKVVGDNSKVQECDTLHLQSVEVDSTSDTSGSTCSGSVMSFSDRHVNQSKGMDRSEVSDTMKQNPWGSKIPSRKRSESRRYGLTIVERLQRDLQCVLQYDKRRRSKSTAECAEGELIYYKNKNHHNIEIGLGTVLLKESITSTKKVSQSQTPNFSLNNK